MNSKKKGSRNAWEIGKLFFGGRSVRADKIPVVADNPKTSVWFLRARARVYYGSGANPGKKAKKRATVDETREYRGQRQNSHSMSISFRCVLPF